MAVTVAKYEPPKIKLTAEGKVFYNDIDLSEHCAGVNVDIRPLGTEVTLTFSDVIFETENRG